jgi:hypothetical protein
MIASYMTSWCHGLSMRVSSRAWLIGLALVTVSTPGWAAQAGGDPHAGMRGMQHEHESADGWEFMQDAAVFLMFNNQGGPRGETEVKAPNWWMGMGSHRVKRGKLTLNLMLSLDPATVGAQGYSEIFQVGETFNGDPLIDHQHPHDFLMQAAAVYRVPLTKGFALTLAGAPVGEPALGPVAFMHRLSSYENPIAPLSHHTLDSTHVTMGVITAGVDRGPFQVEGSTFHGAEPDEQRWDLMDPGPFDSWSVRGWYRPSPSWSFQVSHGFLKQPDASEEGNVGRTTASGEWLRVGAHGWSAVTVAWGLNRKIGGDYNALLLEASHAFGKTLTIFGRLEHDQVETDVLRFGVHTFQGGRKKAHVVLPGSIDYVSTLTLGASHTFWTPRSWDVAAGADLTGYIVPPLLQPTHGDHPVSFHLYFRVRPPAKHRMTEMTMTGPM